LNKEKIKNDYTLLHKLHETANETATQRLFAFFVHAWKVFEPHTQLKNNWHLGLMAEYLEAVELRQIKKLIINIPPRYNKSNLCTVSYPAWVWTRKPWRRFITSSYSDDISSKLSYNRRMLIESEWYRSFWGDTVKLMADQNQKTFYQNEERGFMFATSTGGTVTGEGCDDMIIDDPIKPIESESEVARAKAINHWKTTLSSRFNDPKNCGLVLVMQRLHDEDLTGYFLSEEREGFETLIIPNICEEQIIYSYPRSGRIKIYKENEILQPEREGTKELKNVRRTLGSFGFSAQRQQSPAPRKGGLVQKDWFKIYDVIPDHFEMISLSVDAAFKNLETSDFVVAQVWGRLHSNHYLIDQIRNKLTFTETLTALRSLVAKYPKYNELLIEEKANGAAVIDTLRNELHSLIAIVPKESKIARLNAVSPMIEAGNLWVPNPKLYPWVDDFIQEIITFPKGKFDDQVDAMTQYLNRVRDSSIGKMVETEPDPRFSTSKTLAGSLTSREY